jgi:hypothetical protein
MSFACASLRCNTLFSLSGSQVFVEKDDGEICGGGAGARENVGVNTKVFAESVTEVAMHAAQACTDPITLPCVR